jgi:hypothetical protein
MECTTGNELRLVGPTEILVAKAKQYGLILRLVGIRMSRSRSTTAK